MHIILFIILSLFLNFSSFQDNSAIEDDPSRIVLNTYLPVQAEKLSPAIRSNLKNKLTQITTINGVGGSSINPRFIITGKIDVLSKDIVPTAPPQHAYTLQLTFFIGDGLDGNLYASYSKQIKGVGRSATKAYLSALKNINASDKLISEFIEKGKEKIIGYYNSRCGAIMKEAESLSSRQQYDQALIKLMEIPRAVAGCYEKAMVQATNVYKKKLENECRVNISNSKKAMANEDWEKAISAIRVYTSDMNCYQESLAILDDIRDARCASLFTKAEAAWAARDAAGAASYLSQIPANSACSTKAQKLAEEIGSKLDEIEKREWELEYNKSLEDKKEQNPNPQEEIVPEDSNSENPNFHLAAARDHVFAQAKKRHEDIVYNTTNWN